MSLYRTTLVIILALSGCGDSEKAAGTELGPCYRNGTCNAGLTCASTICVRLPDMGTIDGPVTPDLSMGDLPLPDTASPDTSVDSLVVDSLPPDLVSPPVYGPNGYGEACSDPVATNGCVQGLYCLQLAPPTGFCTEDCTSTGTCSAYTGAGGPLQPMCFGIGYGGNKYCLFMCQSTSDCPTGLVCIQATSTQEICYPSQSP